MTFLFVAFVAFRGKNEPICMRRIMPRSIAPVTIPLFEKSFSERGPRAQVRNMLGVLTDFNRYQSPSITPRG